MDAVRLILASASPRRRALLRQIGVDCECHPAAIDEAALAGESPEVYVARMAREKARAVAPLFLSAGGQTACAVLAADTTVVLDDEILGKPRDRGDAMAMLARLSGREHRVMTAVTLISGAAETSELVTTTVQFAVLDKSTCENYLDTDEPWDKAGSYGIQGLAGAFVLRIDGSYSNVVGLPLAQTRGLLRAAGVPSALDAAAVRDDGRNSLE